MSDQNAAPPAGTDQPPPPGPVERHLHSRYQAAMRHGPFVPLLLGTAALTGWFGLQSWLLVEEQGRLKAAYAAQQQTVENATKLRQSLDALASDTQRLADTGNPNARLLVEELRKRGVTINPKPADSGAPAGK
jgi:hypothetical protein